MAINISTDINVTTGGKLTDVGQIQGGWKSVDSASDAYALTGSATTKGLLEDGQIFYVKSSEELLSVSITGNPPFQTYSFSSFTFPGSGGGSGDITSVVAGDGLSGGASTGDATLTLDTSSTHFTNAVSASAATAGFGSGGGVANAFPHTGSAEITGSLRVDGRITALGEDNGSTTQNNIVFPTKGFGMAIGGYQHISFSKGTGQVSLRGKRTPGSIGSGGSNNIGGVHIANDGGTKVFEYYDSGSALQRIRMQTGDGATVLQVEITGALGITGFPDVSASLAEALSGGASGDITGVTAGDGLSGGGLSGGVTLTLDTSSTHFTNAVNDLMGDSGIFTATGSVYSTTNDLEVTGSLTIADGLLKLKEYTTTPSAVAGAIFYSASALYFGVD